MNQFKNNQFKNNQLSNNQLSLFDSSKIAKPDLGLINSNGKTVVSSRDIARNFEKEHKNVLRDIKSITETDDEFNRLNFEPVEYKDAKGESRPEYLLTRDGFTLLVMGYNGDKAMRFKKAYIAAFNEMERKLAPHNYKDALLALIAKEEAREKLEAENKVLQVIADKFEAQTDTVELYTTGSIAKDHNMTAYELNKILHRHGIQYKPSGSQTWQLYKKYLNNNLARTQLLSVHNGNLQPVLMWTPKGRSFINEIIENCMM